MKGHVEAVHRDGDFNVKTWILIFRLAFVFSFGIVSTQVLVLLERNLIDKFSELLLLLLF